MHDVIKHEYVKEPFKTQARPMSANVTVCDNFLETDFDSISQHLLKFCFGAHTVIKDYS